MNLSLKTLSDVDVTDKKVLVRVDFNVPMQNGTVSNNERIIRSLPTIKELIHRNAKIILISHLGRPKGNGYENEFTLKPVAEELGKILNTRIHFSNDCTGVLAEQAVNNLKNGEVLMLENLRFHQNETSNDPVFARYLASLADIFINDAFSASHRAHASTVSITQYLPSYAGRLMEEEVNALNKALGNPQQPVVAIVGGAKVSTKLMLLHNLIKKVNTIIISGGMGNTFLYAQGVDVKKSLHEPNMKEECLKIIEEATNTNCQLVFPVDAQMSKDLSGNSEVIVQSNRNIPENYEIFDAGPQSVSNFKAILDQSKTLIWNGPLGAFEVSPFNKSTYEIAKYVANLTQNNKIISIAGGGDTVAALHQAGVYNAFTYISTAGGAFLEWMEGKELPGVKVLKKKPQSL